MVKVFMTLLATKDSDHICRLDAYKIAKKCEMDELVVLDILKLLASPDKRRKGHQEFEGRRIKVHEDGWLVLNGQKYREMVQDEMRKARNRRSQEAWRKRQKALKAGKPLSGEVDTLRKLEAGEITQEQADARASRSRERGGPLD